MNDDLSALVDPETGEPLRYSSAGLLEAGNGRTFPVVNGIPRFVAAENYAADFGFQWNQFPKTQLDSYSGVPMSAPRLARCMRGQLGKLTDQKVLEAGSGAGRFTEVLLKYGAIVHSFDFSVAVDANAQNNGESNRLVLAQADIRCIPFRRAAYDYVICLGVLQHTPSPEESMRSLWAMVRPGGALVLDHYKWNWKAVMPPPFGSAGIVYRWIALKLSKEKRFAFIRKATDFWFPIHWFFKDSLLMQRIIRRFSPVHFYYPRFKLRDKQMYYEWALLDTHDATTDYFKHHRTVDQIRNFLQALGAIDVHAEEGGNGVEAFCRKPLPPVAV